MPTTNYFGKSQANRRARQSFKPINVYFLPYGRGFSGKNGFLKGATPTVNQAATLLCTLESLADIGLSAVGEEVVDMPGKEAYTTVPDSIASNFAMTLQGAAVGTFKYILGMSPHLGTAIDWSTYNFGLVGCLIIDKFDQVNGAPTSSLCIPDVKVRVETVGGVPASGTISQSFTFFQEEAKVYLVTGTQRWTYGLFQDNGASVVNAAAPDGIIVAYPLDDCNNSQTTTPPQPLLTRPLEQGYKQYLVVARVDDSIPTTTELTFATATATFTTAPADGKSLLFVYACDDTLYQLPMYHKNTGGQLVLVEDFMGIIA